jgi:hypothetical protein
MADYEFFPPKKNIKSLTFKISGTLIVKKIVCGCEYNNYGMKTLIKVTILTCKRGSF